MDRHWTLDDIPWGRFDRSKVDPDLLCAMKAAALVEHNSGDYVTYLCNVFADDPEFQAAARAWGEEEVQHGRALARWAALADPGFDLGAALKRFTGNFRLPLDAKSSVRGSRAGELVARCVVEVGTSSFYSAVRDATPEPVLQAICQRIAGDEFRHFKLFLGFMRRYQAKAGLSRLKRLRVALGRIEESDDDELASAYWAANEAALPYDRRRHAAAYGWRAGRLYRFGHVRRGVSMVMKACDFDPQGRAGILAARAAWGLLNWRNRRFARLGA